jgi:hypothetical protein
VRQELTTARAEARAHADRAGRLQQNLAAATARAEAESGRVDLLLARLGGAPNGDAEPPRSR